MPLRWCKIEMSIKNTPDLHTEWNWQPDALAQISDAENPQGRFSTLGVEFKITPWVGSIIFLKIDHT